MDEILIEHGHERGVVLASDLGKDGLEGVNVGGAVIGRQRDAGHQDLNVRMHQRGDDLVEIGARLGDGKATETVVAAELDDRDGRMQVENEGQAGDRVLGCSSACAFVDDLVMVAAIIENLL